MMDCKRSVLLLNAYVDRELSKSDQSLLEAHLSECQACAAELDSIRRLDAELRCSIPAPEALRSKVADRLESEVARGSLRSNLKEKLRMKLRWGMAAAVATGLIVTGVMFTGGSAQAALSKMRQAVTEVRSAHLKIQINDPSGVSGLAEKHVSGNASDNDKDEDRDKDKDFDPEDFGEKIGKAFSSGNMEIEFWTKDDRWKMNAFGGFEVLYKDKMVYMLAGDKVVMSTKVEGEDVPDKLGTYLFKEFTKAMDELKGKANFRFVGEVHENGQDLKQIEITGIKDEGKNVRLMYWVDTATDLPARFQVWAGPEGKQSLVTTITCEFNQTYPDSMFEPGGDKP